jgi:hypothetical protein
LVNKCNAVAHISTALSLIWLSQHFSFLFFLCVRYTRWNPAAEMQAIDRTHRLGQHRAIRAVRFIAENTVEERILQLQEKKRLVFDGTVGRDAASLKMLTVDDMKSLFA